MEDDEMAFVVAMGRLGRSDRDRYRQLRQEAWELVQENHRSQTPEQREKWNRNAS